MRFKVATNCIISIFYCMFTSSTFCSLPRGTMTLIEASLVVGINSFTDQIDGVVYKIQVYPKEPRKDREITSSQYKQICLKRFAKKHPAEYRLMKKPEKKGMLFTFFSSEFQDENSKSVRTYIIFPDVIQSLGNSEFKVVNLDQFMVTVTPAKSNTI
ncbi:MAG: hypothetical protein HRT87_07280 [Legionellales bacterium]|nr:hypothetical protein [Legionellales bacterium]